MNRFEEFDNYVKYGKGNKDIEYVIWEKEINRHGAATAWSNSGNMDKEDWLNLMEAVMAHGKIKISDILDYFSPSEIPRYRFRGEVGTENTTESSTKLKN